MKLVAQDDEDRELLRLLKMVAASTSQSMGNMAALALARWCQQALELLHGAAMVELAEHRSKRPTVVRTPE